MSALLALVPLAAVVLLMVGLRWSAAAAGALGAGLAALVAVLGFEFRGTGGLGLAAAFGGMAAEAAWLSFTILWIVFPALCLHELQVRTGAMDVLRRSLARISAHPGITALLVAWFFALFIEGAAGFGTPVALAAPLLVGLGFSPALAVTLALIGHSVGVSFGAVGTPVAAQLGIAELAARELAAPTALLHAALGWTMAAIVYRLATRDGPWTSATAAATSATSTGAAGAAGVPGATGVAGTAGTAGTAGAGASGGRAAAAGGAARVRGGWQWPLLASACFAVPYGLVAVFIGPELPTLAGALVGGVAFTLLVLRHGGGAAPAGGPLAVAALPYLLLLAAILVTRLVPEVQTTLGAARLGWSLAEDTFRGALQPLYHPGSILVACLLATALLRRHAPAPAPRRRCRRGGAPAARGRRAGRDAAARAHHGAHRHGAGARRRLRDAAGRGLAAVRARGRCTRHVRDGLRHRLQHTADRPAGRDRGRDRPAARADARGAGLRRRGRQHRLPAQHRRRQRDRRTGGREGEVLRRTLPACALYATLGGVLVWLMVMACG